MESFAPASIAAIIPANASGSLLPSSFFKRTVIAYPANFVGKIACILRDIYIFRPRICSTASETDATSTCRKPSRRASAFVAVEGAGVSCAEALGPDQNEAVTAVATMLISAAARKYFLARGV